MGSLTGLEILEPNRELMQQPNNTRSPILDSKSGTLAVKCPHCEKAFNVLASLTVDTETAATADDAGAKSAVHEKRKSNNKTRNKGQQKAAAVAVAEKNYTPPKSAEKHKRACDADSDLKDDPPRSKKSKVVNRPLKFNK
ncbi:Hypothetical predicted protein [Olea europaea subsp. europaea]|uniref:Uncharacterized protein n=1 Tax=Olea europaea subsp. europaea TaxID=158383 RepID=A0A8S0QKA1_OLEEU|nr:Hypothetical predicted protein [Olea europaea subsp. europaea]